MTEQEHGQIPIAPPGKNPGGNKPVVVYIMVLFIAAFLLMALSFLMHQRSNSEVMGELQSSVSAIRELQHSQERIDELEQELKTAQETAAALQDANETARNQASHAEHLLEQTQEAADWFWQLNEAYALGNRERCLEILEAMNAKAENPMGEYLGPLASQRYMEILTALGLLEEGTS